jgi:hypothetical protein
MEKTNMEIKLYLDTMNLLSTITFGMKCRNTKVMGIGLDIVLGVIMTNPMGVTHMSTSS